MFISMLSLDAGWVGKDKSVVVKRFDAQKAVSHHVIRYSRI